MSLLAVAVVVPLAACLLAVMLARRRFVVVTVAGASMEPTLRPGDRVLVRRRGSDQPRVGAIVVFREPDRGNWPGAPGPGTASQRWVIKRIAAVPGCGVPDSVRPAVNGTEVVPPGMLVVLGDSVRSGDSRQWGFIPTDQALGLVVRKLAGTAGQCCDQRRDRRDDTNH
jgi:signal peptidase I